MQVELGSVDLGARTVNAWPVEAGLGKGEEVDVMPQIVEESTTLGGPGNSGEIVIPFPP